MANLAVGEQIEVVVAPSDSHALLADGKGKADAQFEQERLHLAQNGCFKIALAGGALESDEIENVGITETRSGESWSERRSRMSSRWISLAGSLERAVRSKSMDWILSSSARMLHCSTRHSSA